MARPKRITTDRKANLVLSASVLIAAIAAVAINTWFAFRSATELSPNLNILSDGIIRRH